MEEAELHRSDESIESMNQSMDSEEEGAGGGGRRGEEEDNETPSIEL